MKADFYSENPEEEEEIPSSLNDDSGSRFEERVELYLTK